MQRNFYDGRADVARLPGPVNIIKREESNFESVLEVGQYRQQVVSIMPPVILQQRTNFVPWPLGREWAGLSGNGDRFRTGVRPVSAMSYVTMLCHTVSCCRTSDFWTVQRPYVSPLPCTVSSPIHSVTLAVHSPCHSVFIAKTEIQDNSSAHLWFNVGRTNWSLDVFFPSVPSSGARPRCPDSPKICWRISGGRSKASAEIHTLASSRTNPYNKNVWQKVLGKSSYENSNTKPT